MLASTDSDAVNSIHANPAASESSSGSQAHQSLEKPDRLLSRAFSIDWIGQTVASVCWIASVFIYGISSTGDWLQLAAASAWLVANLASLVSKISE